MGGAVMGGTTGEGKGSEDGPGTSRATVRVVFGNPLSTVPERAKEAAGAYSGVAFAAADLVKLWRRERVGHPPIDCAPVGSPPTQSEVHQACVRLEDAVDRWLAATGLRL